MFRQEALFRLGASSFADFVTVDLVTHTDVWLPYDLKGRHAENYFNADGSASDVWSSFEVPARYDIFMHAPGFGRIGYRRTAEGEVRYVPVHGSQGELLGYLWASDAENAASFEPLDVGDNASYHAGLAWLERLRSAHDRGLSPSAALAELSATSDTSAGRVDPTREPRTAALAVLRDRSQEGA
ncbi:hypothetical protein C1703_13645 [Streptomyces sp. Go-475]|nr:hypothetical protein C1703_13645 [Streptomyces sp. Go-475]